MERRVVLLLIFTVFVEISKSTDVKHLKCLTWNVNGVAKFAAFVPERNLLREQDVFMLQETFSVDPSLAIELDGFICYHVLGFETGGRPRWGLSMGFKLDTFMGGTLKKVFSPADWLQIIRWVRPFHRGTLFLNVYVPLHTRGITTLDLRVLEETFNDLRQLFPADSILIGGDLNIDIWRVREERALGSYQPPKTKYLLYESINY